jgi:hypothetical protein
MHLLRTRELTDHAGAGEPEAATPAALLRQAVEPASRQW